MVLERRAPEIEQNLGALTPTVDDLVELESLLPEATHRFVEAGPYRVTDLRDLRESSERTLPSLFISRGQLVINIGPEYAHVRYTGDTEHAAVYKIIEFLRARKIFWIAGFSTPRSVLWFALWVVANYALVSTSVDAYRSLDGTLVPRLWLGAGVVGMVLLYAIYWFVQLRIPKRRPIVVREATRWIDRHGMTASLVLATIGIIVAIFTA